MMGDGGGDLFHVRTWLHCSLPQHTYPPPVQNGKIKQKMDALEWEKKVKHIFSCVGGERAEPERKQVKN
jgi:hypothetical protein